LANIFQPNSSSSSSSSGTGKNYLSTYNNNTGNGDFETGGTTGWSLAHSSLTSAFPSTVGSAATSFSSAGGAHGGSAASGNLSLTASNSSPIAGTYSGAYASSAATTAGDMLISDAFTIDTEDQAKVLTFSFYYSATTNPSNGNWSGTSSNSFGVAIYDVTNALWIMPAGVWSMTQSTLAGYATGTFQTTSNSTQYQLAIFNANASSNSITVKFDDLLVGPQTKPFGPAMTDWVAYTPTINGAGTPTSVQFFSRRKGDTLEITGNFIAGTVGATPFWVTPGWNGSNANVTIADSTKIAGGTYSLVGKMTLASVTNPAAKDYTAISIAGSSTIYFGQTRTDSAVSPLAPGSGTSILINTTQYSLFAAVPIQGWGSNSSMSQDTDTRVVAARMTGATATITGSYSDITWTTIANDTHGAMGSISYTAPVTGYYDICGAIDIGATSLSAAGGFFIGLNTGSVILENKFIFDLNVPENESLDFNYGSVFLNAGATFKLQVKTTGTVGTPVINSSATTNFLAVKRLSGPAVVAATESVEAMYHFTGATFTATKMINFDTKDIDTHGAVTTGASWTFLCPVSGKYLITTAFCSSTASTAYLYKNNAIFQTIATTNSSIFAVSRPNVVSCNAGDTFDVRVDANAAATTAGLSGTISNSNFIAIYRIGN
jgi:hypothetical protein